MDDLCKEVCESGISKSSALHILTDTDIRERSLLVGDPICETAETDVTIDYYKWGNRHSPSD